MTIVATSPQVDSIHRLIRIIAVAKKQIQVCDCNKRHVCEAQLSEMLVEHEQRIASLDGRVIHDTCEDEEFKMAASLLLETSCEARRPTYTIPSRTFTPSSFA